MKFFSLQPRDLENIPLVARPVWCENTRGIVAVDEKEEVCAICTLDSWSPNSVQMHLWIGNPMVMRRGFAEEVFGFIFGDAGRNKALCVMPGNNEKVINFNRKMGFTELFRIEDGYDIGTDLVISELKKENCRYIDHG